MGISRDSKQYNMRFFFLTVTVKVKLEEDQLIICKCYFQKFACSTQKKKEFPVWADQVSLHRD